MTWVESLHKPSELVRTTPQGGRWSWNHPPELVRRGFLLWRASDFQRMPSVQELMDIPLSWEADLNQMYQLYRYVKDFPQWQKQFMGNLIQK